MKVFLIILLITFFRSDLICQIGDTSKALLFQNMAWDASQKNYFKKCIRLIDSSIIYDSSKSWSFMIKAEAHWLIGEYADAAKAYEKAMTLGSDFLLVGANVLLGMLYDKADNSGEAKRHYRGLLKTPYFFIS